MNKLLFLVLAGAASASFAASNPDAYRQQAAKAESDYKMARDNCKSQSGNAKDVCQYEAKAARARAMVDATAQYKDDSRALEKARVALAEAEYDVAKEKCDDAASGEKSNCVRDAKANRTTALGQARSGSAMAQHTEDCNTMTGTDKAGCVSRNQASSAGEVVADSVITTKIKADLIKEPELKSMDVHVDTVKGVVMLSGFVPSQAEADKAVQLARSVEGVKEVQSSLKVK